ncbi:MAG: glycosyltransferase family 4 protein [bacterium]|nr:glycosyltransferase family 4 protein [bacterium]
MHILLIHQIFVTPDEGGGTRHYELAKYLVGFGHKITVIASDTDYLSGNKKPLKKEQRDGMDIIYAKTYQAVHKNIFHRALAFLSFSFSSFMEAGKVKNVDVVYATSPPLFQAVSGYFTAVIKRAKFVFEVRDLWVDFANELGLVKNRFIIRFFKTIEKILYRRAAGIIVNSPGFIPFINQYVEDEKIILIPNGVDISDFNNMKSQKEMKKKSGCIDRFIVMYTGNLGVANDIETILKAAVSLKEHKDIQLVFIGGGMKKDFLKEKCISQNIDNVKFIDAVPKSQMPDILSAADVCLATLKDIKLFSTVYPNKVFDYMAAGKPVILAIDGVIKEVIEKSGGGIAVKPGDEKDIAAAILTYYNDRSKLTEHGMKVKKFVAENFERKSIAVDLEKSLKGILSS